MTFYKNQISQSSLKRDARVGVCNQNGPDFYWGIKGNELCVLCAPSVYLISMSFFFSLAQHGQREVNYITKWRDKMPSSSALAVGLCLLCLSVWGLLWIRLGRAGRSIAGGQCEFSQANSSVVHWGLGVGSSQYWGKGPLSSGPNSYT